VNLKRNGKKDIHIWGHYRSIYTKALSNTANYNSTDRLCQGRDWKQSLRYTWCNHDDNVSTAVDYYNTIIASGGLEKKWKKKKSISEGIIEAFTRKHWVILRTTTVRIVYVRAETGNSRSDTRGDPRCKQPCQCLPYNCYGITGHEMPRLAVINLPRLR